MRPIVTDGVAWSVGPSVCHDPEPCKNGWTDRGAIWSVESGASKELRIRRGPDPHVRRGNFEGEGAAHCKV